MLHRPVAAGFEDIVEADEVRLDIGIGVGDGVADACLCSQIDDDLGTILVEDAVDHLLVGDVTLDELIVALGFLGFARNDRQTEVLEGDVVVVVHIVDADDGGILYIFEESLHEVAADEPGCTCHEDGFSV